MTTTHGLEIDGSLTIPKKSGKQRKARILYDFTSEEKNQLTITSGEVVTVYGDVTPENWILAKNPDGKEGYIPNEYFDILSSTSRPPSRKTNSNKKGNKLLTTGYSYNNGTEEFDENNMVLEKKHTYALFAYQFEFFTISIFFLAAFFSFMYAGTQPSDDSWRLYILSWIAFIFSAINVFVCGIDRNKFTIRNSSALLRMVVFIVDAILLIFCWPIGTGPGILCLITAFVEYRVFKLKCDHLPSQITDEWCSHIFGGVNHCPPLKIVIFFFVFLGDIGCIVWGYSNGYETAVEVNEDVSNDYYLRPEPNGMMIGFGRVITINIVLILLCSCKFLLQCFCLNNCCRKYVCEKFFSNCYGNDSEWSILPSSFFHRCLGYGIVWATVCHLISAYFSYLESGAARSFMNIYGLETYFTGFSLLVILAVVVASSNSTLRKLNERLFKQTHWLAVILIIHCMFHGSVDRQFGNFWIIAVGPTVLYVCDMCTRYAMSA